MKRLVVSLLVGYVGIFATAALAGPKWQITDDSWMKLSFLGQVHASYIDGAEPSTDVYLRRARIILSGQIMEDVLFFAETDNDNAGRNGFPDSSTDIQDIFVDARIMDSHQWVKAGLILLPFSFENRSSAASLMGIDYNAGAVKLVNTFVWRDYGAELHGDFLNKKLAYAVGVFDGYDSETSTKSSDAGARVTGHAVWSVIGEAETGWFYDQDRRGKAGNYLELGAGFDQQNKASEIPGIDDVPSTTMDSEAWVLDFKGGMDAGPVNLLLDGAWYDWDNARFKGNTAFIEGGVNWDKTMLTGKYLLQDRDNADSINDYTVGVHYFIKNHNLRGGIEYRWGDSPDAVLAGIQFLL